MRSLAPCCCWCWKPLTSCVTTPQLLLHQLQPLHRWMVSSQSALRRAAAAPGLAGQPWAEPAAAGSGCARASAQSSQTHSPSGSLHASMTTQHTWSVNTAAARCRTSCDIFPRCPAVWQAAVQCHTTMSSLGRSSLTCNTSTSEFPAPYGCTRVLTTKDFAVVGSQRLPLSWAASSNAAPLCSATHPRAQTGP